MQEPNKPLAVLLLDGHVACFARDEHCSWRHERLCGEPWYPVGESDQSLATVLNELDARLNRSGQLADFALHLVCDKTALPWLDDLATALAEVQCSNWQVLQWGPLRDRTSVLTGKVPAVPLPSIDWLQQGLLPVLESTLTYQDDAQAAERARAEQEHVDTLESLRADRLRLEAELATQREQLAALKRPAIDELVTFLPAIYRNVFGTIAPHDLALLAGSLQVPQIPSPWPEPAPDTLKAKQEELRKLPEDNAERLRNFCRKLPHKLELRAEVRAWLERVGG